MSIPESISEQCAYDQELGNCGHYLSLYSHFGDPFESGDGFEEWAVRILPVVDDNATPLDTSDDVTLGTAAITDVLPKDIDFSRTFGPFGTEQCGTHTFTNTAEFTTVDQSLTGSDDHTVSIQVTCPATDRQDHLPVFSRDPSP